MWPGVVLGSEGTAWRCGPEGGGKRLLANPSMGDGTVGRIAVREIYARKPVDIPLRSVRRREDSVPPSEAFMRERAAGEGLFAGDEGVLVVRRASEGYELLAGDRDFLRWAAAGKETGPAVVLELEDVEALFVRLVLASNRRELNPLEEARIYQRLTAEFGMSQDEIGAAIGKVQSTIANKLRLLKLEGEIQEGIRTGRIGERHARALLRLEDSELRLKLYRECVRKNWSAEEMELAVALKAGIRSPLQAKSRRRVGVYRDLRIFQNSLRQIAREMLRAGLRCEVAEEESGGTWVFRVAVSLEGKESCGKRLGGEGEAGQAGGLGKI
ncbi:MAG: ParB/RepB/Spo0J family partition protein [Firmicutes bacterium]|nr:ParB/RepB/Spo0J family partition protein [Candidatus Fermentithermobacillaceae bacterium]